jgi:hypothetical protein
MEFFKTDEGRIHGNRIAGIIYVFIFLTACLAGHEPGALCGSRVTFAISWWIAFCARHPPRTWAEYETNFRFNSGALLVFSSISQQIYALWSLAHAGSR